MLSNIIGNLAQQRANMVWETAKKQAPANNAMVQSSGGRQDVVELSAAAPKPLSQSQLAGALSAGGELASLSNGDTASASTMGQLRESRVQAALAVLCAANVDPESSQNFWPGGLPSPSPAEIKEAYRRLSQKLTAGEGVSSEDSEQLKAKRIELIENFRDADFGSLAARFGYNQSYQSTEATQAPYSPLLAYAG